MSVSIKRLRAFLVLAEELQFGRAAKRLDISQSTLSLQMRDLEEEVGVSLFARTTRLIMLTEEGETFRRSASLIVREFETAVSELQERSTLRRGRLVVAATPTTISSLALPSIKAFSRAFPQIEIILHEALSPEIEIMISRGEVDVAFGPNIPESRKISFAHMFDDAFYALTRNGSSLAAQSEVTLQELIRHRLLTISNRTGARQTIEDAFRGAGVSYVFHDVIHRHETVIEMVEAGLGVAVLPGTALKNVDRERFDVTEIVDPGITRQVGLIGRKEGSRSSTVSQFVQMALEPLRIAELQA